MSEEDLKQIQKRINMQIQSAISYILNKEVAAAMGRVRLIIQSDLNGQYSWYLEPEKKDV